MTGNQRQPRHARTARRLNAIARRFPHAQRAAARWHARLFLITGGRFLPNWYGAPVLVLQITGRRSGRRRSAPILYLDTGEAFVVLAANAGVDTTPAWWHNLVAANSGEIVISRRRRTVRPRVLTGAERARLWSEFAAMYPQAHYYAQFTERPLPLIALEPA